MDKDRRETIAKALTNRKVNLPCPRCGTAHFEVYGQTLLTLNDDLTTIKLGGPAVPAAVVVCSNCGFVTLHALGALKLLKEPSNQ